MRLAVIASHPIQYYAPWFRFLARETPLEIRVFYLWDFGVETRKDPKFGRKIAWDIPLLDGYDSEFMENTSPDPGTHHFRGLENPDLASSLFKWNPDAGLFTTLFFKSPLQVLLHCKRHRIPCFFRGDSHLLGSSVPSALSLRHACKRVSFSLFNGCLYVGQANREYFLHYGVPSSRLYPSPHAIDNNRFARLDSDQDAWLRQTRERLDLTPDSCIFLFVGKFEGKKRPGLVSECFSQIRNPKARLVFVGDGILKPDLEAMAASDPRIKILPFQNQSLMPAVYRLGDCLVLPSYGPHETWGLAVNEAMACGIPAIVSSHVGCAGDLIEDGQTGWVFPADQPEALASILSSLAEDPSQIKAACVPVQNKIKQYSYQAATNGLLRGISLA